MNRTEALKQFFGYDSFREGQEELIAALEQGRDVLGILPTGGGKSLCYQIPAILCAGVTIVISPLISLMIDQVHALNEAGVPAAYLNSALTQNQYRIALARAEQGAYKIIYVAPERLLTPGFLRLCEKLPIDLVAVDEAHCVSQWGQDFRPGYLGIPDFLQKLPYRPPVGAFTATATPRVREDMIRLLGLQRPLCRTTGFDRKNLTLSILHPEQKQEALLHFVKNHPNRSGIIYCSTRRSVEDICRLLQAEGYPATRYHAGLTDEERAINQQEFLFDRAPIMVATNAFGMGIDKSNVRFVIHYQMPQSIEAYYQEVGRAGRDGAKAECVLFYHAMDLRTNYWLLKNAEPNPSFTPEQQQEVLRGQYRRLEAMQELYQTAGCIRRHILHYFGEIAPDKCDNCSNCLDQGTRVPLRTKKRHREDFSGDDEQLYEALKALRADIARKNHHPAFTIFSDATLIDLVHRRPKTLEEFLSVSGVGKRKQELYGERFLKVINPKSPRKKEKTAAPFDREWALLEEVLLLRELQNGVSVEQACRIHRCTAEDVERHQQNARKAEAERLKKR